MSDSMWKKEISFKRKPKADAETPVEAPAPAQSFLKKEISFSRKPKADAEAPVEASAPGQSFLKKEISFSRKPKEKKEKKEKAPKPASTSLLKKEISFSRAKKHDREVERLVQAAEQTVAPSFAPGEPAAADTLPMALAEAAVAEMVPAPVEQPVAPAPFEPVPVEPVPVEPVPVAVAEPEYEPRALAAVPDPVSDPVPEPVLEPVPVAPVPVAPVPVNPVPVEPLPVEPQPLAPAAAVDVAPEPVVAAPAPVDTWLAEPELPPAPVAPPVAAPIPPVTVHPPVAAADLPPLPDEPKVPFWKKELSLSKSSKAPKAPKAPKAAKAAKAPKAPKAPTGERVPFWKKELSFGKKSSAPQDEAQAQALPAAAEPKAAGAPFWKKQLSFSKPSLGRPGGRSGGHGAKKLVGLKIGASQLAAARISNNGVAELQQVAREPLAAGIVVGGELRDPEALGDALKLFFAKNKLPRKGVRLGIASNRIGVRTFDIVGVDQDKQLTNAVHFRAQEALPIPLDEAVLDYQVLSESVDDEGQTVKRVLLVVAYRELVERYVSACRKAGITLAGIDLEAFALLRALAAPSDSGTAALVAVSIGHDRSTLAVSDGGVCEFTRVLEWGGWSLNVALARVFDSTPSEVEAIKRSLSLEADSAPEGLTEEQAAQALDAVRRQVQSFARELVSSLQFYQNQPGSLGIGEIVLTGGSTGMPGLAAELERLIGVHVRVGDPLARLKVPKRLGTAEQLGSYAVAIGLGIED